MNYNTITELIDLVTKISNELLVIMSDKEGKMSDEEYASIRGHLKEILEKIIFP